MKQAGSGSPIDARMLECVVAAAVALLAADMVRAAFQPFWQAVRLLFGI